MARKATDLLDVFRYGGGDDDDKNVTSSSRGRTAKQAKRKKRAAPSGKKGFDGLILTRRQVVLGASVCCLLVALSFVLGLSAGRPGDDTPAASRTAGAETAIVIRGTMTAVNPSTQKAIDVEDLRRELVHEFRVPSDSLRIRAEEGRLVLEIGVFASQEAAESWLKQRALDMAHLYGSSPFTPPQYVRVR